MLILSQMRARIVQARRTASWCFVESCRILVVEDDQDIRDAIAAALAEAGYSVRTAHDGGEALDALHRESSARIHLILLDLMMPRVNGWEFLQHKQKDRMICAIPVLVLTASTDTSATRLDKVVGKLTKPFELDALLDRVRALCPAGTGDSPP
jgi:chemotaxis family two-component system sensor histidine kinase/response regulator PixL